MNRSEFLKLTTGILAGLGIPGVTTAAAPTKAEPLNDRFLEQGLTAMVRAQTWFDAHWGAGILAGYYLCRDHPLDAATVASIRRQMDTVIEVRAEQFTPKEKGRAEEKRIAEVTEVLRPAMQGGLRAHGHAVIFASLSTRALRDAPQMARAEIIEPLCGLSQQIAKLKPQKPAADAQGYSDTQAMIEATFDSLARFRPLLGHAEIRRPNFTHMITHTEALMNLEQMGFAELARAGHLGHRTHISAPVPAVAGNTAANANRVALESVMRHFLDRRGEHRSLEGAVESIHEPQWRLGRLRPPFQSALQPPSPHQPHPRCRQNIAVQRDPAGALCEPGSAGWLTAAHL